MAWASLPVPRRSERVRQLALKSGFEHSLDLNSGVCDQCCACLLEIDTSGEEGELLGTLNCCQPLHTFHVGCILTWAEQENTCPQCKLRFSSVGIYDCTGNLIRVSRVMERDQGMSDGEGSEDDDDTVCQVCKKSDHPDSLLLCDGQGGRCSGACHYYCVGLEGVPEGDWFCPPCVASVELRRRSTSSICCNEDATFHSLSVDHGAENQAEAFDVRRVKLEPLDLEDEHDDVAPPSYDSPVQVKSELGGVSGQAIADNLGSGAPQHAGESKVEPTTLKEAAIATGSSKSKGSRVAQSEKLEVQRNYTEGGSSSSTSGAIVPYEGSKKRAKGEANLSADPFNGLCNKIPKWISRQGLTIRVDLAGKGMRDAVAVVFAKVVLPALQQILDGVDPGSGFAVSMHLAGNELHRPGLAALLEATANANAHVGWLYVERNRLDNSAAEWLAKWVTEQPGGALRGLHMSQNKVGDKGALKLLEALGSCKRPRGVVAPIWVELNDNRIRDASSLLDEISERIPICLAMDRSVCSLTRCIEDKDGGNLPILHLCDIMAQDDGNIDREPLQIKSETQTPPTKKIKLESIGSSQLQLEDRKQTSQGMPRRKDSYVLPSELPLATSGTKQEIESAVVQGVADVEPASQAQGRGRARGRGRGRGRSQAPVNPATSPAEDVPPQVAAKIAEAEARKSWAQNLGNGMKINNHGYDDTLKEAPPSYGLWELARTKRKNRTKSRDTLITELIMGVEQTPTRTSVIGSVAPSTMRSIAGASPGRPVQPPSALHMPVVSANSSNSAPIVQQTRWTSTSVVSVPHSPKDESRLASRVSSKPKVTIDASLKSFVMNQLVEKSGRWSNLSDHERRLRRCCLCDQLCRLAHAKYKEMVKDSWDNYLRTSKGRERISQWVQKKVTEGSDVRTIHV